MKNSNIRLVLITGMISVIGMLGIQTYWVVSTWSINDVEFKTKVNFSLNNVANQIAQLKDITIPISDRVEQQTSNYFIVSTEAEVDNMSVLEYYLKREFKKNQLLIDFEYAIFDCTTDQMIYGNFCKYSPDSKSDPQLGNLPVYEGSASSYYFGVKFPTLPGYMLGKMQLSIFFSFILLLTIVFFTYAMVVILKQKRLSELQKDFINNMTHEFKTPLSSIKISAEVLLSNPFIQQDSRLLQYANIIKKQNQRLNNQVEKVLQIAKVEKGLNLSLENIDFSPIWDNFCQDAKMRMEELGGVLHMNLLDGETIIKADRLHLTNILYSILDNAIKYQEGEPQIWLSINKTIDQDINISIKDAGVGIPAEYQSRVFEKFFRIPTGNIHNVKGFGLGLFYVKHICEAHNWKIDLESQTGEGTKISILIPYNQPKAVSRRYPDILSSGVPSSKT